MVKYSVQYVNNAWLHPVLAAWAMITQLIFNYYVTEWPAPVSPRLKQQVSLSQILHSHIQIHNICNTPIQEQLSFCANNCIENHCFKMLSFAGEASSRNHESLSIIDCYLQTFFESLIICQIQTIHRRNQKNQDIMI